MKTPFIVLEGPDGSGTTKHTELLVERLRKEGFAAHATAEPSGGSIGKHIRTMLSDGSLCPEALQLLFTADRADHLHKEIFPALQRGDIVVCDRYVPSTIAYGKALGLDVSWLEDLNDLFLRPGCMLFALPPYAVCQERLGRRETRDSLETDELQRKVYDNYRALADEHPTIPVIDTSGFKEDVHEQIWAIVKPLLTH